MSGSAAGSAGRPRRVVILLDSLVGMGGAETLAVALAEGLDPSRNERAVCLTRWSDESAAEPEVADALAVLEASGTGVIPVRRTSRFAVRPWLRLVRELRRLRPDVIHAHKFGSNAWGVLVGRLARVPVIIAHEHMWSYAESSALRRFVDRRWIAPGADVLIAVSEAGRHDMIEIEGVPAEEVVYVPNGVPEIPAGDPGAVRRELGIAPDDPIVGTLGRLSPEKALDDLVLAAAELRASRPDIRVLIAGEGTERATLEAMIVERGLAENVFLLGYRTDRADLLAAMDVAVCCSRFEGGPLSVMEYMDAGLGIVATNAGGLPELVEHERTGLLVEPGAPGELATAIDRLLSDRDLARRLGAAARDLKRERHGIDAWIRRIEQLYDDLLPEKPD